MPKKQDKNSDLIAEILNNSDNFFERKIYGYISRMLEQASPDSPFGLRICQSAERNLLIRLDGLKGNFPKDKEERKSFYLRKGSNQKVVPEDWETLKSFFQSRLKETSDGKPDGFYDNLMRLADYLGLDETGKDVLTFLDVVRRDIIPSSFIDGCFDKKTSVPAGIALMLGREKEYKKIADLLSASGPLATYGLIYIDGPDFLQDQSDKNDVLPEIDDSLIRDLSEPDLDEHAILQRLLGEPKKSGLTLDDFDYLGEDLNFVVRLIENALKKGETGINILLYGEVGSGKTELSKVLAQHFGVQIFGIGEEDSFAPGASSYQRRMMEMRRAQALLRNSKRSILLFDEMEDLLMKGTDTSKKADTESKIGLNRLLETNPVLTIWTANDPEKFHPAVRRRFSYSAHVSRQPTLIRKKAWEHHLASHKLTLPAEDVLELARKYEAPPSMIGKAIRNAALIGGNKAEIEESIKADARITYEVDGGAGGVEVNGFIPSNYDLDLLNGGEGFNKKVDQLIGKIQRSESFALLANVRQGSGISTLTRYIGEKGRKNVMEFSMAALRQPPPFSTPEKYMKSVFNAAANNNSVLVIRDLEYLVGPGGKGQWLGNSLVETFKTALSQTRQPFIGVYQNENADIHGSVAALFSHDLKLDYLTPKQADEAYKLFFGQDAPEQLKEVKNLVPANFAAVRRILDMTKEKDANGLDDSRVLDLLKREKHYQQVSETSRPKLGFRT